jgi:hypothetical protein
MIFATRTLPLLFAVFALSVAVRWPQLNRPLSKHHEFCTAVSLRILYIWQQQGIAQVGFNPAMNFSNSADKFINNHANTSGKMLDNQGNYYYVSHPPFAYYFPFFVFKLLQIEADVLPLQILNMCLHFLSALFVYFTMCLLSFNRARSYPHLASLVAFTVYVFSPPTLWFQGNVYMSDMAVHTLFVIGVYTTLKMVIRQRFYSVKYLFFYVATLFLMIYTSWLGLFFAFGVLVYSLLHVKEIKGFKIIIALTVVVTLLALRIITYQYSQINGLEAYLTEILLRYLARGSLADTSQGLLYFIFSYVSLFKTLFLNYLINYLPVYLLLVGFIWMALSKAKLKIIFSENGYRFIWLSVLPIVLLHLFLLNYSIQDFTVLYASLFFSVLLAVLYDKMKKSGVFTIPQLHAMVLVFVFISILQFQLINLPGPVSILGKPYALAKQAGEFIAQNSASDEVIFVLGKEPEPQEIWYAKRNMVWCTSEEHFRKLFVEKGEPKSVVFSYDEKGVKLLRRTE